MFKGFLCIFAITLLVITLRLRGLHRDLKVQSGGLGGSPDFLFIGHGSSD
jgi:hypothetical protein